MPRITAREYLLRVTEAGGPKGSARAAHTHPGSEAFYVLKGELSHRTPDGVARLTAGQSMVGHGTDTPMAVSNSGSDRVIWGHCLGLIRNAPGQSDLKRLRLMFSSEDSDQLLRSEKVARCWTRNSSAAS